MTSEDIIRLVIGIGALVLSVMIHEMAHAWSALKMGDPTGKNDNRLSWNPVYHIDPFMTILLPIMTFLLWGFPFGGAKPVMVNANNFKNPGKGMMISSACGPLSNFLLMGIAFGLLLAAVKYAPQMVMGEVSGRHYLTYNGLFLFYMMLVNLMLGVFNLIPIPPLDGSRVLRYLLPENGKRFLDQIEPFGLFIIIGILYVGGFALIMAPAGHFFGDLLRTTFDADVLEAIDRTLRRT